MEATTRLLAPSRAPAGMELRDAVAGAVGPGSKLRLPPVALPITVAGDRDDPWRSPLYLIRALDEVEWTRQHGTFQELVSYRPDVKHVDVGGHDALIGSIDSLAGAPQVAWREQARIVIVEGRRAGRDDVLRVARTVDVPTSGPVRLRGGPDVLAAVDDAPVPVATATFRSATTDGRPNDHDVRIVALTASEQVVARALLLDDPRRDLPGNTQGLAPDTFDAPTTVDVGDRAGIVGTVNAFQRMLIVAGDPGVAVVTSGNDEEHGGFLSPAELVDVAQSLRPADQAELEAGVERQLRDGPIADNIARANAAESAAGWRVVRDGHDGPFSDRVWWVLSVGDTPRPEVSESGVCMRSVWPGAGGRASCIGRSDFHAPIAVADPDAMAGYLFATASSTVRDVHLELPNGAKVAGYLYPLDLGGGYPAQFATLVFGVNQALKVPLSARDWPNIAVVALDHAGREVYRTTIGKLDGPTP
ncbi:MAG TPA: hypothetical protein VFK42_14780 [Acidimicrobiales bacterium]|nr:hypothetical protein [Acidimicrobiales bacterium]